MDNTHVFLFNNILQHDVFRCFLQKNQAIGMQASSISVTLAAGRDNPDIMQEAESLMWADCL
ncbi:hypothetical protein [Sodalis sp. RH22]|uniref:hypothetical protein n=1 Tax=unclassified Sodalis (in: enterobacteria) TaxID=2636512 RepID=UPI0039B61445